MRARGAKVTDIVILVVAADDGVKQQTVEAIDHAKAADVPIIVAINKVDKPEANVDKVKQQLSELGLTAEDWGGKTVMCEVSAKKKTGIDNLLDMILLVAEMQDLKADIYKKGRGYIIEAKMDPGRGPVATLLLLDGILKVGDLFIAGAISGRVRALITDRGEKVEEMKATAPVEVLGIPELPMAGDTFQVIDDEVKARRIQTYRQNQQREKSLAVSVDDRITLENLFDKISQGEIKGFSRSSANRAYRTQHR
jgi:translation initiation factor IF-2